jgi:plasmid stabilization system protein ParE
MTAQFEVNRVSAFAWLLAALTLLGCGKAAVDRTDAAGQDAGPQVADLGAEAGKADTDADPLEGSLPQFDAGVPADGGEASEPHFALAYHQSLRSNRSAALFDKDGDGDIDIACASSTKLWLLENQGAGIFEETAAIDVRCGTGWGAHDFNADGRLDLHQSMADAFDALIVEPRGARGRELVFHGSRRNLCRSRPPRLSSTCLTTPSLVSTRNC